MLCVNDHTGRWEINSGLQHWGEGLYGGETENKKQTKTPWILLLLHAGSICNKYSMCWPDCSAGQLTGHITESSFAHVNTVEFNVAGIRGRKWDLFALKYYRDQSNINKKIKMVRLMLLIVSRMTGNWPQLGLPESLW